MEPSWSILATCPHCGTSFTAIEDTREGVAGAAIRLGEHLRLQHGQGDAEAGAAARQWLQIGECELAALLARRDGRHDLN